MTKEQLIDLLGDTAAELNELVRRLRDAQETMAFEEEAEEEEAPEADFHVGDIVDFVNVNKEGNMEFLTGTVIDGPARDDNGWYCRAETREGRKFKTPINLTDTRLGTRVQRIHEH